MRKGEQQMTKEEADKILAAGEVTSILLLVRDQLSLKKAMALAGVMAMAHENWTDAHTAKYGTHARELAQSMDYDR
jgi:hypothetical protein